jgi:hypothetical protein
MCPTRREQALCLNIRALLTLFQKAACPLRGGEDGKCTDRRYHRHYYRGVEGASRHFGKSSQNGKKALNQHKAVLNAGFLLGLRSDLKMEEICSSETSVYFKQTARRYIQDYRAFHNHRCVTFRSYFPVSCIPRILVNPNYALDKMYK